MCAWVATAALRVDSGGGAACGHPRWRCYMWTPKVVARHVDGQGGGMTSGRPRRQRCTLTARSLTLTFVPLFWRQRSTSVPYNVPLHFVPCFGMKFPEWGTAYRSSFPVSKDGYKRAVGRRLCLCRRRHPLHRGRPAGHDVPVRGAQWW
jgi:hypothetical protein